MASDLSYAASENTGTGTKSSKKIEKSLKWLLVTAGIIFTAQLIWLFGISPFIPFSTVEVHEFAGFGRSDILHAAGIDDTSSFISTNVVEVKERLVNHLLVESAIVIKRFPDKLSIYPSPRQAAAIALANTGSGQMPLYVDRQGVFFKAGEAYLPEASLPILSGFENPRLNMRLPPALVPLVENLCEIASSSPELLAAISEIRIERKAWEGFDLVLYPVHSAIRVRMENNLTEDALRYMLLMLNVFEESSQKPAEIDFRSGMSSYRIKEQSL
jgi:cell division protein FtsQ